MKAVHVVSFDDDEDQDVDMDVYEESEFAVIPDIEDSPIQARRRREAYLQAWSACEASIHSVLERIYADTIQQIQTFVQEAPVELTRLRRSIPTGLVLGANQTLSAALCNSLQKGVNRSSSRGRANGHVKDDILVRLSSRDFPNKRVGLKNLIQAVIDSGSARSDRHEDMRRPGGRKPAILAPDDMHVLQAWYQAKFEQSSAHDRPKIVLYLEDFEAFESAVLTDLIHILSAHCHQLPFVLVFAIATSVNAVYNLLPRATSELLRVAHFTVAQGIDTFHTLMQEVFIYGSQPVSPGYRMFSMLRDTFLDYNQSIDGVVSKLQYMYMAHFYANPLAALTIRSEGYAGDDGNIAALATHIRALSTFRRLVAHKINQPAYRADMRLLLEDDQKLLERVAAYSEEREEYGQKLPQAWKLFACLQDMLVENSVANDVLIMEYYKDKLVSRATGACQALRRSRDDRCLGFLRMAVERFKDDVPAQLDDALEQLEYIMETGQRQSGRTSFVNTNEMGGVAQTEGDRAFSKFVANLADSLSKYFSESLKPYSSLTLHEIWYFDEHKLVRNTFHPPLLTSIQASLHTPASRIPKHLMEVEEIEAFLKRDDTDLCSVYKLGADAGKLVNLADWHGAFELSARKAAEETRSAKRAKTVSARHAGQDGGNSEAQVPLDLQIDARFLAGVADLAFLGFVQSTKRKAEHVARIVF